MLYNIAMAYLDAKSFGLEDEARLAYLAFLRVARKLGVEPVAYMITARRIWRLKNAATIAA